MKKFENLALLFRNYFVNINSLLIFKGKDFLRNELKLNNDLNFMIYI